LLFVVVIATHTNKRQVKKGWGVWGLLCGVFLNYLIKHVSVALHGFGCNGAWVVCFG
jgi:hypothetical protein